MKTCLIPLVMAASLLVGCNKSVEQASQDFNQLPPAVQDTVRAHAPDAEIASVDRRTENGLEVFEIQFRDSDRNPPIVVGADGRMLGSDTTAKPPGAIEKLFTPTGAVGTKFSALPIEVQQAIQRHAPNAEISDISRREDDGRVVYEIQFRDDGQNPPLHVGEDGTLLHETPR